MKQLKGMVALLLVLSILSACGGGEVQERMEFAVTQTSAKQKEKTEKEQRAERIATDFNEVKGAIAYDAEEELLVAFHVRQFQKFFTEKIEKKIKKALEEEFPEETIVVSHDLKIRIEIERLRQDIEEKNLSQKEIKKRIKKIDDLRKEKA